MIKFFKKTVLLFTLACAFTMLFMPVNVKADNGNDGIVAFDDLNEEDFKEANEALCEIGRNAKRARTGLSVYNYKEAPMEDSLFTDLVAGAMVMERPVIIGMCKANGDSHYVVARGYSTTTGEIYILDPGSRSTNKLSTYTDAGAAITAVLIYGR